MHEHPATSKHRSISIGAANAVAPTMTTQGIGIADTTADPRDGSTPPAFFCPTMTLDPKRAALVVIDPQIDVSDTNGRTGPVLGKDGAGDQTLRNLARLLAASKRAGITVAVSLTSESAADRGRDLVSALAPFIEDDGTIICSPHERYSPLPRTGDIGLRLRKRCVEQVVLAGVIATFPIEVHLRSLLAQGFEVAVVRDAIAGPKLPEGNGFLAALVNFRRIAKVLWTTEETLERLGQTPPTASDPTRSEQRS